MIGYNPSHLNKNETLLEAFHRVEAYLKANPQYQVYQSSAQYQENTQLYTLNTIIVPEGSKVRAGDVVFFSNAYYSVITDVSELTFSVEYASSFRGPQGPQGPKGDRGTGGAGSNPNLLINPNFAINQRGQTSYTGTVYGPDRWKLAYGTLELQSNGEIKHTSSGTWQGVAQYIENPSRLAGKTVTISAMGRVEGATAFRIYLYYQIGDNARVTVCTAQTTSTTNTIISASGTIPADITDSDKLYFMLYNATANTSFYCKWTKLEIGSVATEFSPPSIAEELPKCYRYFIKLQTAIMPAYSTNATSARYSICLPTNMRIAPTINFSSGNGYIMYNGKSNAVTANTVYIMTGNTITITATTTGLSGNNSCSFTTGTDVVMSLDAEI